MKENREKRNVNIELLRITSMLMIITLHYFYQGGILENITLADGIHYYIVWLAETLCFVSVNFYVLISGYFLIKEKFSLKKIFFLLLEIWFYSMGIYLIFCLCGQETFNLKSVLTAYLFPTIKGQWWFASIYVVLYLLYPLLNKAILGLSRKEHQFCIRILFILFCIIPKVFFFSVDQIGIKDGYSFLWFIMLYITAAYFRIYEDAFKNVKFILVFIAMIFATAGIKFLQIKVLEREYINFYSYNSPTIYVASICLFLSAVRKKSDKKYFNKYICNIAKSTFGVFLIHTHPVIRNWIWDEIIRPSQHIGEYGYLLIVIALIFCVCTGIDYLRRYLFGMFEHRKKLNSLVRRLERKYFKIYLEEENAENG